MIYPFDLAARNMLHLNGHDVKTGDNISQYWDHLPEEVGEDAMNWLWGAGRRDLFESAPPYPGSIKAIRKIEQRARIMFLTHRPLDVAHVTMRWLAKHKLNPHMLIHAAGVPKSEYVLNTGCVAFVEDRSDNAREIDANTDAQVFVPYRGWNQDIMEEPYSSIIMFDDWDVVVDYVISLTGGK